MIRFLPMSFRLGYLPLLLCLLVVRAVGATDHDSHYYDGPSIMAQVVNENRHYPEASFINKLMICRTGLRLETASHSPAEKPNLFIQNFITDQAWLVDQTRKIYVEIPVTDDDLSVAEEEYASGMAATAACEGLNKKAAGTREWRGFKVSVWDCDPGNGAIIRQLYSPYWGLVVREENTAGISSELRQIKRVEFDPDVFKPPADHRVTDLKELLHGVSELEDYNH